MNFSKDLIVAYIPVIHQGYLNFLKPYAKDRYTILLIDENLAGRLPKFNVYFGRDVRKIPAAECQKFLEQQGYIVLLSKDLPLDYEKFLASFNKIIMPDEDVSKEIMEVFPESKKKTELVRIFLRYDKNMLGKKFNVSVDGVVTEDDMAKEMLGLAYEKSKKSPDWWRQVGCVIRTTDEKTIVSYNDHIPHYLIACELGDPRGNFNAGEGIHYSLAMHAEGGAVSYAANNGISLKGATAYVTTFPCPGCARYLAASGIKKVYFCEGYSLQDAEEVFRSYCIEVFKVKMEEAVNA